ncbi:MAG: hypothetical protein ACQERB_10640 [Promethearchaeati archaeon]
MVDKGVKHNGLFRLRNCHIIHGDTNGAGNIDRKKHPDLFSIEIIAYNFGLNSEFYLAYNFLPDHLKSKHKTLTHSERRRFKSLVNRFLMSPRILFSPSNGILIKELKREERLNKSKIRK